MRAYINNIRKELNRNGSDLVVSKVKGRPGLCEVTYAGNLSGLYEADRLLNVLKQLRTTDAGEDHNSDVCASLSQIGFETEENLPHVHVSEKARITA